MSSTPQTLSDQRLLGLDRFVLERHLGEGAMGAVYLAYDRERDARVALKTLRRVDASGIYRFKREFRALADLSHPNLVVLHELFAEGTEWFFTMEYVEGKTFIPYLLGDAPREPIDLSARGTREMPGKAVRSAVLSALFPTPLEDFDELRAILQQITEAIMAVHQAGKLHRDLKPDNVMVTENGRAVVLDFGIAIENAPDVMHKTLEAGVMGTPAYMSPEQAAGGEVDEATDWYALGVMLFEALTGTVPFDGSYLEVMHEKQVVDPPTPSEIVSGVPPELDLLCSRLLSRDRHTRPRGPEILQALRGTGQSVPPRHSSKPALPEDSRPPFVGRAAEFKELERALLATDDGMPVLCFVQGHSGMGKSALVERFLDDVRKNNRAVVLQGRCYERETMPFKAWDSVIDSLSRYLGKLPPYAAAEVMPKDIEALTHIFPVLKRVEILSRIKRRHRLPSDLRDLRRRAFVALKEMLWRIGNREPLVVYIDDAQWGDVESARLIVELITGSDRPAMLLVCTYRSGDVEVSPCLKALFDHTRENKQTDIRQIDVAALSEAECVELVGKLVDGSSAGDAAAIAREARGNPYLVEEIVHHMRGGHGDADTLRTDSQSVSLQGALTERLSRLSHGAFTLLELVAVAGRPVHEEILASLTPSDVDLHTALTELRRAKLIRGVGTARARAVELFHDGIRDSVLSSMGTPAIKEWHRRLATALETQGSPDLQALTQHLIGAEDFARAGIYAIRAAVQANRSLAFEQAAELYAIAVKYHEDQAWRHELMVQWGDALVNARAGTQAAQVYLEAAQHAEGAERLELHRKAGVQLLLSGHFERSVDVLADTLQALDVKMPKTVHEALDSSLRLRQQLESRGLGFTPTRAADVPAVMRQRLDHLWPIAVALQLVHPLLAQPLLVRHLMDALEAGDPKRILPALCGYFMNVDLFLSAIEGRKPRSLQLAEQLTREGADPYGRAWLALAQGFSYQNLGMLKPTVSLFTQAEDLFRNQCQGATAEVRTCRHLLAALYPMLGNFEDLARCEQWMREAEERDDRNGARRLRLLTVFAALIAGDTTKAEARIQQGRAGESFDVNDLTTLLEGLARSQLALYTADTQKCAALLGEIDRLLLSPLCAVRTWRGIFHLQRARVALMCSTADVDGTRLGSTEQSLEALEELNMPNFADHARMLRAAVAWRRGQNDEARRILDTILADDEQAGDGPIVLATARLCKAQMVLPLEAAPLREQARNAMRTRGIEDAVAFCRLYAPGFDRPAAHP
jgi:eukaryotic-like serine/threonine-protein kinase